MVNNGSQQQQDSNLKGSPDATNTPISSPIRKVPPCAELNTGTGDPTDGREQYQWSTCYPRQARVEIRLESIYLFFVFLVSLSAIFAAWKGWGNALLLLSPAQALVLKKYVYYAGSGMLGGVSFGIKYFYRVVARGYWHQDRRIWRLMSPLLAMAVAIIVGAMIDATLLPTRVAMSGAAFVSIGFLAGYFADQAIAKMLEVATVLFGKSAMMKDGDGK